jgi:uncharacterized protein (TIGR03083 family)
MKTKVFPAETYIQLIEELDRLLLECLRVLSFEEWHTPTSVPGWRIRDIAAHLLDGNIRAISMIRDGYFGVSAPVNPNFRELVSFLNELNGTWVEAARRISPPMIISLLEHTGRQYIQMLKKLPPEAPSLFSVAWAGEDVSTNAFHIAREYTEKWHHQQQIRSAAGDENTLMTRQFFHPYLVTSLFAIPYQYRPIPAEEKTLIQINITGEGGGTWYLIRESDSWQLNDGINSKANATIDIADSIIWRIFTKGISADEAKKLSTFDGDPVFIEPFFSTLAVMG